LANSGETDDLGGDEPIPGSGWRGQIPAIREKCRETVAFSVNFGKTVQKSSEILGSCRKIPYSGEQGTFFVEQGIETPCSGRNRDISHLRHRPFNVFHASICREIGTTKEPKLIDADWFICTLALGKSRNVRDRTLASPRQTGKVR
jgi:hypothetical protein